MPLALPHRELRARQAWAASGGVGCAEESGGRDGGAIYGQERQRRMPGEANGAERGEDVHWRGVERVDVARRRRPYSSRRIAHGVLVLEMAAGAAGVATQGIRYAAARPSPGVKEERWAYARGDVEGDGGLDYAFLLLKMRMGVRARAGCLRGRQYMQRKGNGGIWEGEKKIESMKKR
ncbi:hypothetical protein B0H19DRAFT_1370346 [Mycena capillaripes]|nr:hypothetical protein B0H19DRAFT_1370346 [Mycena capillaripes]